MKGHISFVFKFIAKSEINVHLKNLLLFLVRFSFREVLLIFSTQYLLNFTKTLLLHKMS